VKKYQKLIRKNPVDFIIDKLKSAWGEKFDKEVRFPIFLKIGKVDK